MKKIDKTDLQKIENYFANIKSNGISSANNKDLETILNKTFHKKFKVNIIPAKERNYSFVMAVIPEKSVITKITTSIGKNQSKVETISSLWKKCNSWLIEIDDRILDTTFSDSELTALLLHEIGHVVESDSVPKRLFDVIQYGVISSSIDTRSMLKRNLFSKVLSIPFIRSCMFGNNSIDLKKEIKADQYASMNGYTDYLVSAMTKIETRSLGTNDINHDLNISMDALDALKERKAKLMKESFADYCEGLPDCFLKESVQEIERAIFEPYEKNTFTEERVYENAYKDIEHIIEEGYYTEFFGLGKQKVQPILQNQIDYITAKSQDIQSVDDKIMILSYINGKLETIQYYLDILANPKVAKKFIIPNSESQLVRFQTQLNNVKTFVLKYKIPDKRDELVVWYPKGYEG